MKQFFLLISIILISISSFAQRPESRISELAINTSSFVEDKDSEPVSVIADRIKTYLTAIEGVGYYGSVLVEIKKEKVISSGYGFRNKELKLKNAKETIFDIGSITKQFTAAAILKLEMQGKLSVDDKISKYFANVPEDKQSITVHDLLRHQTGLISNIGKDFEKITEEEFIEKVMNSKLGFENGTTFSYSNIGYSLLSIIIEKVSGESYETFLYENLWKPAKMEMTGYTRPKFDTLQIAIGYDRFESAWGKPTDKEWDKSAPYWHLKGNGGVLSTTEDMYKWHRALMTTTILNAAAIEKFYHPKIRSNEDINSIYAYGWDVSKTSRNTTRIWHSGTNRIFYADLMRYTDENVTIITLSNKAHPDFNGVSREISRMIFEEKYRPEIPVIDNEENRAFTKQVIELLEKSGLEEALKVYNARNKKTNLLEFEMRDAGFDFIDNNKPAIAILIFDMNAYAFPNSSKAIQGLAEGYMETGQKELAIMNFKKSLLLNPDNRFVKDKLAELENQK